MQYVFRGLSYVVGLSSINIHTNIFTKKALFPKVVS